MLILHGYDHKILMKSPWPLTPFLFGPKDENLYDSSAIGEWLDTHSPVASNPKLIPADPKYRFLVKLIDEYADEFGLYLLHHVRWNWGAKNMAAPTILAEEIRPMTGPLCFIMKRWFGPRQVQRCQYLFSIAPKNYAIEGVSNKMTPPSRSGFPETHTILNEAFKRLCQILENIFSQRPYLFGENFTLADASIYGQIGALLYDPAPLEWLKQQHPALHQWINKIYDGEISEYKADAEFTCDDLLKALLSEIARTYIPLQQQQLAAYNKHKAQGQSLFNEKAFWKNQALYDGVIDGMPFRSVVKTFQVKTWLEVLEAWEKVPQNDPIKNMLACITEQQAIDSAA